MADRLVGLLGSGTGPRMYTAKMENLVAKISNLTSGQLQIHHDGGVITTESGGDFPVPDSQWVRFEHLGKCKALICILQSRTHALSSA